MVFLTLVNAVILQNTPWYILFFKLSIKNRIENKKRDMCIVEASDKSHSIVTRHLQPLLPGWPRHGSANRDRWLVHRLASKMTSRRPASKRHRHA